MKIALLALATLVATPTRADEGMWTLDAFPKDKVEQRYGFRPSDAWLRHVQLASARLAGGCSASFVSPSGLVVTNHHCAHRCVEQLSTAQRDLVHAGFLAPSAGEELRCPDMEVNQLLTISDVTRRMNQATAGLSGQRFFEAQRAEMARIEKECQSSPALRCEVVTLYHGGVYDLYRYRRFQDVRLVFAPEFEIAFFGGDPDNFMFPRYDLDVAFLRVYEDGRPAAVGDFFRWSPTGPRDGELTFVSGHPGGTERQLTVAELRYQRDVALPERLLDLAELRGLLTEFQRRGPEQKRISNATLFYVENSFKALRGRFEALLDARFFASKVAAEEALKAKVAQDPEKARTVLPAFDAIAGAEERLKDLHLRLRWIENGSRGVATGAGFAGELFRIARTLVRGAEERPKPNEVRLREFRDSALPAVTQQLFSPAPIYPEFEALELGHSLSKLRENLGPDDPFVRKVLGKDAPDALAERLVRGTRLADVSVRRQLWEGGKAAVDASRDPLIELARRIDADGRALRKQYEDEVESVLRRNDEIVARARFEVEGTSTYPDATFTLRLSYGQVKGWEEHGRAVAPFTVLAGAFDRATGRDPFALPASWIAARPRLDLDTPFNFCTTNDIIGGNSGSPVIDREARLVGIAFDGNIHSLGGEYGFDEAKNRAIAVDSAAVLEALRKIYGAERLVRELQEPGAGAGGD